MPQLLGFGDGSDGDLVISSNTTDSVPASTCAGTAGTKILTVASLAGFTTGMMVGVYQMRGANAGRWEFGQVATYVGTTLTLQNNLDYTYTNTSGDASQVKQLKQYRSINIQPGFTWQPTAWNDTTQVGGILSHFVARDFINNGTLLGTGLGFFGGLDGEYALSQWGGGYGEGTLGSRGPRRAVTGNVPTANNGSGGGGGGGQSGGGSGSGGGGGGHSSVGTNGENGGGTGGAIAGSADGSTISPGGAGGGGGSAPGNGSSTQGGPGGASGSILQFFVGGRFYGTGVVTNAGVGGSNASRIGIDESGGGGGGTGGTNFFEGREIDVSSMTVTAPGGAGGAGSNGGERGGIGSDGRNIFKACTITGDSVQPANKTLGGFSFCTVPGQIV